MAGVHDLGGQPGFGPIPMVYDDREYKERWEFVLMSMTRAAYSRPLFRADALRYAIERIPTSAYLTMPYYARMLTGATQVYLEMGIVALEDLQRHAPPHVKFPSVSEKLPAHHGGAPLVADRFEVGDRVTVRDDLPEGHVRVPGYVRGRTGVLLRKGHKLPFPGQAGHQVPAALERTWLVQFSSSDIWKDAKEPDGRITVDMWDSYLIAPDDGASAN